jgi:hypothetical protein
MNGMYVFEHIQTQYKQTHGLAHKCVYWNRTRDLLRNTRNQQLHRIGRRIFNATFDMTQLKSLSQAEILST